MTTHIPQLCLHHLTFKRHHHVLFSKLNFTINGGDIIQVRGHNGCGKSTFLRILAGFIEPKKGMITWDGRCISKQRDIYIENMIYVGHRNAIKPSLTVYENVLLKCALLGYKSDNLNFIMKKIGLNAVLHKRAQYLSAGQLRRLSLAKLILAPAKLWLLDEPNTALDDEGQQLLNTLLLEHAAKNGITIIATHQALPLNHSMKTIFLGHPYAT